MFVWFMSWKKLEILKFSHPEKSTEPRRVSADDGNTTGGLLGLQKQLQQSPELPVVVRNWKIFFWYGMA